MSLCFSDSGSLRGYTWGAGCSCFSYTPAALGRMESWLPYPPCFVFVVVLFSFFFLFFVLFFFFFFFPQIPLKLQQNVHYCVLATAAQPALIGGLSKPVMSWTFYYPSLFCSSHCVRMSDAVCWCLTT